MHASIGFITKAVTSPETGNFPYSFGFRLKKSFTWERRCEWLPATSSDNGLDSPKILILQDTDGKFTNEDCAVQFFRQVRPAWVIYHMQLPLGSGDIWDVVRFGPFQSDAEQDPMQLIVVVTADDLRATGIELSHGLSWEKTCEDFVLNLGSHSQTDTLATCAHLVVLFGCDGVIYHRGRGADQQTLFYDPRRLEGDFAKQHMEWLPGVTEAFTAGMSANIAQDPSGGITDSIFFGLKTARRLMQHGYQLQDQDGLLTCSADRVMNSVWPDDNIASVVIPSEDICGALNPHWTILELAAPSPLEVARQIVEFGSPVPARQIPMARFGSLYLYDRGEIEQFQWIYHLIEEYLDGYRDTPLNIALFGPGGSGKRFAGVEVVKAACQSRRTQQLSFNLSQFQKVEDLRAAFRSIRDSCLDGCMSVVYLKGFDADFSDRPMGWISELLSCLGRNPYCDNGRVQAIGRAILLFEAASSATFREFGRRTRSSDAAQRARQGSEFISHLHGFVDVLGPDRREPSDNLFTVRRAVLLRALLEDKTSNPIDNERLRVDDDILDGLLLVSKFHDGARSLRALLEMCKLSRCSVLNHLGLPLRLR